MARVMTRTSLSCSASLSVFAIAESVAAFGVCLAGDGEAVADLEADGLADALGSAVPAFFTSSSLRFFFSCLARSSAFVPLVNAIVLPSGDQAGLPAPFGRSVNENESPPAIGKIDNWAGSGLPSFSAARTKSRYFPSGDQRGVES